MPDALKHDRHGRLFLGNILPPSLPLSLCYAPREPNFFPRRRQRVHFSIIATSSMKLLIRSSHQVCVFLFFFSFFSQVQASALPSVYLAKVPEGSFPFRRKSNIFSKPLCPGSQFPSFIVQEAASGSLASLPLPPKRPSSSAYPLFHFRDHNS